MYSKKRKRKTPSLRDLVISRIRQARAEKVVDLATVRALKERRAEEAADMHQYDPAHAAYLSALHVIADATGALANFPELSRLCDRSEEAEEEYMPEGPPMSPITRTMYLTWTLFDLPDDRTGETWGEVVEVAFREGKGDPALISIVERLNASSLGFFVNVRRDGPRFLLRDLVTGEEHRAIIPSGYQGSAGDLLLLRLAPPPHPDAPHSVALTTPYVIAEPGVSEWAAYFDRTLPAIQGGDRNAAYRKLMRKGHVPHGDRYWLEYVFEAYGGHSESMILLRGLPDVAASRPHA